MWNSQSLRCVRRTTSFWHNSLQKYLINHLNALTLRLNFPNPHIFNWYWQMSCESADREYYLEWFLPAVYLGFICYICCLFLYIQKVQNCGGKGGKPQTIFFLRARRKNGQIYNNQRPFFTWWLQEKSADGKFMPNSG